MKYSKYTPYVRRAQSNDRASNGDWRTAIRLEFYRALGKPFFVMLQHGFRNEVMVVGRTKRETQRQVWTRGLTFNQWARKLGSRNRPDPRDTRKGR